MSETIHPTEDDLRLALGAAVRAGRAVLPSFRTEQEVRHKGPGQPVTDADLLADRILRETLLGARPGYGWLSEETADSPERLSRQVVWVVDPLDGTRSFVNGFPEWAVSVGLAVGGRPVLGVVHNPATGETYHAVAGGGAFRDGVPIRVAEPGEGTRRLVASRSEIRRGELDAFGPGWEVAPLGSTTWKMAYVADGRAHAFLSRGPKAEWDVCAASLIVSEAGGVATDAAGAPLTFNRPDPAVRGTLAAHPEVHAALLAQMAGGRR